MKPIRGKSKIGDIEFHYQDDTEKVNRGWIVDKVTAKLNDTEIGYLKISYISSENFSKFYRDILDYINNIKGWCLSERDGDVMEYVKSILRHADMNTSNQMYRDKYDSNKYTKEWAKNKLDELIKVLSKKYKAEFEEFKNYFIDKPLVDYIKVETKYRGMGIGYGLYVAGAKWMAEKNMALYASNLQSSYAKKSWARMKNSPLPVKNEKCRFNGKTITRIRLDYR